MKILYALSVLVSFSTFVLSQNNISDIYNVGVLNGEFKSWHSNGSLKAKGDYKENLKTGEWNIWDSTGTLLMKREYGENNELLVITYHDNGAVIDSFYQHPSIKNEEDYFPFYNVDESNVVFSKRIWRRINRSKLNERLFLNDALYSEWINLIHSGQIMGFSAQSEKFNDTLKAHEIADYKGKKVVGFKLKEDFYYDKTRLSGSTRIIGICPIIELEGEEIDAFWVHYPEVRSHLAKMNLDDVFYFHQFNSVVIKRSNVFGKTLTDYVAPEKMKEEILSLESHLIETEVNLWIFHNRTKK